MAENKTALGLEVPGQVINSYKDLKNAVKAAKDEQVKASEQFGISSAEYKKAAKNVADLNDKMEDLGDSSRSLKGSGIERSAQGFSQLGEGLRNLDLDKVKVGLNAIKSALAATGIMLLVQGVMYLIENFEELSKGSGLLGTVLRGVGKIISELKALFDDLTDSIGLTNTTLDKLAETVNKHTQETNKYLQEYNHNLDNQIKLLKANGESTVELEKKKQLAIIATNVLIVQQLIALVRAGKELSEEQRQQVTASIQLIKDARVEQKVIEINHNKEVNANYKAASEERKKQMDLEAEHKAELLRQESEAMDNLFAKQQELREKDLESETAYKAEQDRLNDLNHQNDLARVEKLKNDKIAADKQHTEDSIANTNAMLEATKISFESTAQLVNFLYDLKRSKLQKGSAEELKAAKRQFQINKALAIQSSIISGIQGVINALSAQSVIPEPYGTILKVATAVGVGIAATVNTAKIASQQFNEGGGGGGDATASTGNIGSAATAAPPTLATPQNTPPKTTAFDDNGKNQSLVIKAEVVETESTEAQKRVARFQDQATF